MPQVEQIWPGELTLTFCVVIVSFVHFILCQIIWNQPNLSLFLKVFSFIFISWRLITLQYCNVFCHPLTWISHGFTCVPHPYPPSHLPHHPIPLGLPSAPALSTCLIHPTWAGGLFHPWYYTCFSVILSEHPTLEICSVHLCLFFCFVQSFKS